MLPEPIPDSRPAGEQGLRALFVLGAGAFLVLFVLGLYDAGRGGRLLEFGAMDDALRYQAAGDLERAGQQFEATTLISPENGAAHRNLGDIRMQQGRVDEALAAYGQAIRWGAGDANLFYNMGVAHGLKKEYEAAAGAFERALRLDPAMPRAQHNLAWAQREALRGKGPLLP
jgi:tetratricopeptide (TPR) repeat protein